MYNIKPTIISYIQYIGYYKTNFSTKKPETIEPNMCETIMARYIIYIPNISSKLSELTNIKNVIAKSIISIQVSIILCFFYLKQILRFQLEIVLKINSLWLYKI